MNIIVVGCGRVGSEMAYRLQRREHRVTVVDARSGAFENLPSDFLGHTVHGDALSQGVLGRAGIESADGLAAVTNSDAVNSVVAHVARRLYRVSNVVARNYDPRWSSMHACFGAQVVSSATYDAQRLAQILLQSDIEGVFTAGSGEVVLCELPVPAAWAGRKMDDVLSDPDIRTAAVTRSGRAELPDDRPLAEGDLVLVAATVEGISRLHALLRAAREA